MAQSLCSFALPIRNECSFVTCRILGADSQWQPHWINARHSLRSQHVFISIDQVKVEARRIIFLCLGWLSLGLGIIGVFLPLLPTTPFLLLTAYCFARSSPKLHAALLSHPRLGPPLRDWQERKVIRPRAKATALALLAATLVFSWYKIPMEKWPLQLIPTLACIASGIFIMTRKSR